VGGVGKSSEPSDSGPGDDVAGAFLFTPLSEARALPIREEDGTGSDCEGTKALCLWACLLSLRLCKGDGGGDLRRPVVRADGVCELPKEEEGTALVVGREGETSSVSRSWSPERVFLVRPNGPLFDVDLDNKSYEALNWRYVYNECRQSHGWLHVLGGTLQTCLVWLLWDHRILELQTFRDGITREPSTSPMKW
jgi:hypothetical protein